MMFRRRDPEPRRTRLRLLVLPRRSVGRSVRYYGKRVARLSGSPHAISAGVAVGAAVSWTPFLGFHYLLAFLLAFALRGNLIAAALGTIVGNPLTFPLIWLLIYETGQFIIGGNGPGAALATESLSDGLFASSIDTLWPALKPMIIGAVPWALAVGFAFYAIVRWLLTAYHHRRRHRLAERLAAREDSPPAVEPAAGRGP